MKRVVCLYFSPTGNTKKIVEYIGNELGIALDLSVQKIDFTLKHIREEYYEFSREDIMVIGLPVIAGRVPNLMLDFLNSLEFKGSKIVSIVTFGNRAFDDALRELADICKNKRGLVIGAGAFVGEHSFSQVLGRARPDESDLALCDELVEKVSEKIRLNYKVAINDLIDGRGAKERVYYKPIDNKGRHIDIRKAKPKTKDICDSCMWCTNNCPLGSIESKNPRLVSGICMKCCSCVKGCHLGAKYFDDEGFLYHKVDLERKYGNLRVDSKIYY